MPIYKKEGVEAAIRRNRKRVRLERDRHVHAMRFIEDHAPWIAERVKGCREYWKTYESVARPEHYKVVPHACHVLPWCIACAQAQEYGRVRNALDRIWQCTPKGEQPRLMHVVQTAPLTDQWEGWGLEASRDPAKFSKIVYDNVADFLGEGVGTVQSYQDFGERGFAKRHPHIDLTVSGWKPGLEGPERIPAFDLKGRGRAKVDDAMAARSTAFGLNASRGNFYASKWYRGSSYLRILRYQMREMVDLRKMVYAPNKNAVYWCDYSQNRRAKLTVVEFKASIEEYRARLGQWPQAGDRRINLHRYYGCVSDRTWRATSKHLGGKPFPHKKNCTCQECGDWDRVFLVEEERERQTLLA